MFCVSCRADVDRRPGRVWSLHRSRRVRVRGDGQLVLSAVPLGEERQVAAEARQPRRRRAERAGLVRQDVPPAAEVVRHAGHGGYAAGLEGAWRVRGRFRSVCRFVATIWRFPPPPSKAVLGWCAHNSVGLCHVPHGTRVNQT